MISDAKVGSCEYTKNTKICTKENIDAEGVMRYLFGHLVGVRLLSFGVT